MTRFRGERASGYRRSTAVALARGKTIENRLAQLFLEPLRARGGDRRRRPPHGKRVAGAGQARDADSADALGSRAAKARNALASAGGAAASASARFPRRRSGDANCKACSAAGSAAGSRHAPATASTASGRSESAAAFSPPRAARQDARLRRGMGQDEARVKRRPADVARFRDGMLDALIV